MNKLIAFVLALALALTLVGCTNKEKSNENNETHIFQGEIIEFDNTNYAKPLLDCFFTSKLLYVEPCFNKSFLR